MPSERSQRLHAGLNRQKGKRLQPGYARILSDALGVPITTTRFLTIEKTESLWRKFLEAQTAIRTGHGWLRDYERCEWSESNENRTLSAVTAMAMVSSSLAGDFVLFLPEQRFTGAIIVPGEQVMARFPYVSAALDSHYGATWDVNLTSDGERDGLAWRFEFYDVDGVYHREGIRQIVAWGRFAGIGLCS